MNVLAVIIIAPHMSASGAVNAALALSKATANHCSVDIAIMAHKNHESSFGNARLLKCKSTNLFAFTQSFLPDRFRTLFYRSNIPELIKKNKYDIVHIHNPIPTLEMKRVAETCVRNQVPYVVSTHGFVEVTSGGDAYRLQKWYEKWAWQHLIEKPLSYVCQHSSRIFSLSPYEEDILIQKLNIKEDNIRVVTNGVNENFLTTLSSDVIDKVAQKYGLPSKSDQINPVCFYVGNHTANKGIDILLEAFTLVEHDFTLIVGGKRKDYVNYEEVISRSTPHRKIIFTDLIPDEDLPALFQYSDLFVYPTLSDTLPLVILEAMASGLAIISTNVGGIPYQVTDDYGTLVKAGDAKAFAGAVSVFLQNKSSLNEKGRCAKSSVVDKFSWEKSGELAFEYYEELT